MRITNFTSRHRKVEQAFQDLKAAFEQEQEKTARLAEQLGHTQAQLAEQLAHTQARLAEYRLAEQRERAQDQLAEHQQAERLERAQAQQAEQLERAQDQLAERLELAQAQLAERLGHAQDQQAERIEHAQDQLSERLGHAQDQQAERLEHTQAQLDEHRLDQNSDHWMSRFGYDNLIAALQLTAVEQHAPGNRKRLEALRDTHAGETCFVIGNGPSLKPEDLTRLHQAGVFTFAAKQVHIIYDKTPWRPSVWAASDLPYIQAHIDEISQLSGCLKLLPCQTIVNLDLEADGAIYYPFIQIERTPAWFNADILRGVHFFGTITGKMINMAVYMGFREIYLLGVDHAWPVHRDAQGNAVYEQGAATHFSAEYRNEEEKRQDRDGAEELMHTIEVISRSYRDIRYFCDRLGVRVVNATRGGKLETFGRADFDEVVQKLSKENSI